MNNLSVNESNLDTLCEAARAITGTNQMKILLILECILGVVAILPNALNVFLLYRVKVFHLNLRILLAHLSFDATFYSLSMAKKALVRLLTPTCNLPISTRRCLMKDWLLTIPLHNAMLALVILYLERVYCTLWFRSYDSSRKKPYLAAALLVCAWTCTLSIQLSTYYKAPANVTLPICEPIFISPQQALTLGASFISLEVLALALFVFVFAYNQFVRNRMAVNRAHFDLSSRFQVDQNVKINAALLPSAVVHELCFIPNYIFIIGIFAIDRFNFPAETRAWLFHLSCVWRIVYACVHPTLLICLNPNMKRSLLKTTAGRHIRSMFRCGKVDAVPNVNENRVYATSVHFDYLRSAWYPDYLDPQKKVVAKTRFCTGASKWNAEVSVCPQVAWSRDNGKLAEGACRDDVAADSAVQIRL